VQTSEVTEEVGAPAAAMVRAEGVKARSVHIPCTPHMRVEPPRCPETGSTPCIPEELCHSRQVPLEEAAMVAGGEGLVTAASVVAGMAEVVPVGVGTAEAATEVAVRMLEVAVEHMAVSLPPHSGSLSWHSWRSKMEAGWDNRCSMRTMTPAEALPALP
jgi:hypothetical protein